MAVSPQPNHRASELFGYTINFFWGGLGHCPPGWSLSVRAPPSVIPSRFPEQRQFRVQRCLCTGAWRHGFLFLIGSEACQLCPANLTPEWAALSAHLCSL